MPLIFYCSILVDNFIKILLIVGFRDEETATEIAWIIVYLSALSDIATSMLLKGGILQLLIERLSNSNSLQLLIPVTFEETLYCSKIQDCSYITTDYAIQVIAFRAHYTHISMNDKYRILTMILIFQTLHS